MSVDVYAVDVSSLDPDVAAWKRWIDAPRLAVAAGLRLRDDRARSVGAGLLLAYAVRRYRPGHPLPLRVEIAPTGQPFLPDLPGFHFSISHSGRWAVCAAADHSVGVDIEQVSDRLLEVAPCCFSPAECDYLRTCPEAGRAAAACELWVLKESYMKAVGLGFQLPIEHVSLRLGPPLRVLHNGIPARGGVALCSFADAAYRLGLADLQSDSPTACVDSIRNICEKMP